MMNDVLFSSKSDEWATPQEVFDSLNSEFNFNLDPCATEENRKCDKWYSKEDDGLSKSWGGAECFAIHHTARSGGGLKKRFTRGKKTIQR